MLDKWAIEIRYFDAGRKGRTFILRSASIEWVELRVRQPVRNNYPKGDLSILLAHATQQDIERGCYGIRLDGKIIGQVSINEIDRD